MERIVTSHLLSTFIEPPLCAIDYSRQWGSGGEEVNQSPRPQGVYILVQRDRQPNEQVKQSFL